MLNSANPADEIWINAQIATMVPNGVPYGAIHDAAIAVKGNKIVWLGSRQQLPGAPEQLAKSVRSAQGAWITPGLIDCHTHLVYAGNRAKEFALRLQGASYAEIAAQGGGIRATVNKTRLVDEYDLYHISLPRFLDLVCSGATTLEIKSGYGLDLPNELKMLRVARRLAAHYPVTIKTTFLGAHSVPEEYANRADAYIDYLCQEVLPAACAENLVDAVDVFCEHIAFNLAQTRKMFEAAKALKLPVKIHAEQLSDYNGAALAAEYGALSADHLEYISEAGVTALAAAGTVAVLLPGAFYFLRETRKPPVDLLRKHGVPIAIATDCNPGTSPLTSLPLAMNMACTQFGLTPEEALLGVTRHAAQALGMGASHGTLEVGKTADFILWEIAALEELAYWIGHDPLGAIIQDGVVSYVKNDNFNE